MLKKQRWLYAAFGVLLLSGEVQAQQAIRWQPTLESAKRVAGQTNRLVLIHFWAPWCEACRRMDRDVFGQPEVGSALETDYVPVKLNADHFPATAQQYGVSALPTQVIIRPQGQLVEKFQGALGSSQYLAQLKRIAENSRNGPTQQDTQLSSTPPPAEAGRGRLPAGTPGNQQPGASRYSDDRYANYFNKRPSETAPAGPRYGQPPQAQTGMDASRAPSRNAPSPNRDERQRLALESGPAAYSQRQPQGSVPPQSPQLPQAVQPGQTTPAGQLQPSPADSRGALLPGPPAQQLAGPTGRSPAGVAQPPAAGSQSAPVTRPPTGNPPLGLDGYCPVELTEAQRWQLGDRRWGAIHRGRTYLFAGSTQQQRFLVNPDSYSPVIAGDDVVLTLDQRQSVAGRREHGVFFGGRIYLFANEASLEKFSRDPHHYADAVLQSMRTAPRQAYR